MADQKIQKALRDIFEYLNIDTEMSLDATVVTYIERLIREEVPSYDELTSLQAEVERLKNALALEVPKLEARLAPLESQLAAANAIIETLPKTADRVAVYLGMEVWAYNTHATVRKISDGGEHGTIVEWGNAEGPQGWARLSSCYSTPQAAQEAADAK